MARSLVPGRSSQVSGRGSQSPYLRLLHLRVLRPRCTHPPPFHSELVHHRLTPTPSIDDRRSANPRMRGFLHAVPIIARERGLRGFFAGFVPTTARQAANSATRFSSYAALRQLAQSYAEPGEKLGSVPTFGIGAAAGLITVYVTQPIDTVKTRMQTPDARQVYRNSLACAATIVRTEGVLTLWSGALPRLARLMMSGGIVFTMYEKSIELMDQIDPGKRYI
jgi:solute carrier family 25 citrate transporter 1